MALSLGISKEQDFLGRLQDETAPFQAGLRGQAILSTQGPVSPA